MVYPRRFSLCFVGAFIATGCASDRIGSNGTSASPEAKAIAFLSREVPAWYPANGCFSCHNNGDAARALYLAKSKGYYIPPASLATTTGWLVQPARWDHNKGDPGFSDQRLADIQFAASLVAASKAGAITSRKALESAAQRVAAGQDKNGAWPIDKHNPAGSPATYGVALATCMALSILEAANPVAFREQIHKGRSYLARTESNSVVSAATLLLASVKDRSLQQARGAFLQILRTAESRDGGWGPYADSPPEPFDTAVVLLALKACSDKDNVGPWVQRGREFLVSRQNPDGSWPASTRPAGGISYAQQISTTAWATIALLETR